MNLADGGEAFADADPVGHHDALIAPVIAQNLGEQVVVAHRELAVDFVVRCHDGPGIALAHGNFEATQIDFTCGTLADTLVHASAVGLLRVDGEVLGGDACALALHTVDVGGSNLTRQQRVF